MSKVNFRVKNREHEIFVASDGHIELYDLKDPYKTGYIFNDIKELKIYINNLTDSILKLEGTNEQ